MAKYAYRDKDRKVVLYSSQAIKEDRNTAFYCPNSFCDAKLYICAIDGSKNTYFRATNSEFKHVLNCSYGNSNIWFDENKFDESKFVYDEAIDNLLSSTKTTSVTHKTIRHRTGKSNSHPPRTLRQIYSMCKSLDEKSKYGDKEIGKMILDDRSEYRYPKGCFGNKIIEAVVRGKIYDKNKKEIFVIAPINSQKYSFILSFSDEKLFKTICSEIYNNRDKIVVVAGKWESASKYNSFNTKVYGKKQVAIIKK